eukprot:6490525-Amphidinium_carterae.1
MKSLLQEGQDLVIELSSPGVTHRAWEVSYQVCVLGEKATAQYVYGNVRRRAVIGAVLNKGAKRNQSLPESVRVSLEERINVSTDAHRDRSIRVTTFPYGLATQREPLYVRGTRVISRTCRSPYVEFAGVEA